MSQEVMFCHQCAQENEPQLTFCAHCGSPLHLQGDAAKVRPCLQCNLSNQSFAKFCLRCAAPLVRNPNKEEVDPIVPFVLKNPGAEGGDYCPSCGRTTQALSAYVSEQQAAERASRVEIIGYDGLVAGRIKGRGGVSKYYLEPKPEPLPIGTPAILGLAFFGCFALYMLRFVLGSASPIFVTALIGTAVAIGIGYRRFQQGQTARFEAAQSRWRRARLCRNCWTVFVSGEKVYTSTNHLDRIVWQTDSK